MNVGLMGDAGFLQKRVCMCRAFRNDYTLFLKTTWNCPYDGVSTLPYLRASQEVLASLVFLKTYPRPYFSLCACLLSCGTREKNYLKESTLPESK